MDNSDNGWIKRVFSRTPKTINTKKECYALYRVGYFGNKALAWDSYDEVMNNGWRGDVCIRSRTKMRRGRVRFNVPLKKLRFEIEKMIKQGSFEKDLSFNQAMPDDELRIQGEIMRTIEGLYVLYTTVKKPMNQGLEEEELHAQGLDAKLLLQKNLFPSSYNDIMDLLEEFPKDIIEFSSYNMPVGHIKGRNAVIWEVRNY